MKRLLVALLFVSTQALAQSPAPRPPQPLPVFLQTQYNLLKANLVGAAEKMPTESFAFKPTADVRSYAAILGHVVESQYMFCSAAKGLPIPEFSVGLEKKATDKVTVVQMVKDVFAYCDDVFGRATNESLVDMITLGAAPNTRQIARGNQLLMVLTHGNEHYGNLVTYLRLKGIVPPSSAQ